MATIIDSLVVQLGLDPRGFTEGQQQAVESLRQVERAAERTGAHVDEVGVGVLEFIRLIENPARGIVRHLERIAEPARGAQRSLAGVAAQARRTGTAGEAGTLAMASGVRALAIAGLVATAVFAGLGKVIESALGSARQTFAVGIGAAAAGLPVNEFSAISQALFAHGNVPQEQTQDWLAGVRQFQEAPFLGKPIDTEKARAFGVLGINALDRSQSPEAIMEQLARKFAEEQDKALVIAQGATVGLGARASLALQAAGLNLPGYTAEARRTGVTQGDVRAATDLLNAENQLSITYGKLYRTIFTDLDPSLTRLLSGLTEFAADLITITPGLWPFFSALGKINTLFDDMTTGWGEALGHWVASGNKKPYDDWLHKLMGDMGLGPAATPSASGTAGGPQTAADLAKDFPRLSPAQVGVLSQIRQRESGGNYQAVNKNDAAGNPAPQAQWHYGAWQFGDPTWRTASAAIGAAGQFAHASDAPRNIQDQAAAWLYLNKGTAPWAASGPYPQVPAVTAISPPAAVQGMLQGAQRGALAMNSSSVVTNNNDHGATVSTGPINVYTQAKDGPGVVAAIREAINRNLLAGQANTGLS
ncbi:MAG: hypothetical protein WB764_10610 [Xanthobacteraceae bacterium]